MPVTYHTLTPAKAFVPAPAYAIAQTAYVARVVCEVRVQEHTKLTKPPVLLLAWHSSEPSSFTKAFSADGSPCQHWHEPEKGGPATAYSNAYEGPRAQERSISSRLPNELFHYTAAFNKEQQAEGTKSGLPIFLLKTSPPRDARAKWTHTGAA